MLIFLNFHTVNKRITTLTAMADELIILLFDKRGPNYKKRTTYGEVWTISWASKLVAALSSHFRHSVCKRPSNYPTNILKKNPEAAVEQFHLSHEEGPVKTVLLIHFSTETRVEAGVLSLHIQTFLTWFIRQTYGV